LGLEILGPPLQGRSQMREGSGDGSRPPAKTITDWTKDGPHCSTKSG